MNRTKRIVIVAITAGMLVGPSLIAQVAPQQQMQQQTQTSVSDAELTKFAGAYQEIQVENQKIQQEMVTVIQGEGLEVQRFNEIHQANMTPESEVEVSNEEETKYEKVIEKMEAKQTAFNEKIEAVIEDQGLTLNRYQEIGMALQSDQALQQKLQSKMGAPGQ